MVEFKRILKKINWHDFKTYLFFSVLLIATLIIFRGLELTQARYESEVELDIAPNLAFFIVDVTSASGQIKLESMVPREEPYLYTFSVSNFKNGQRANVDLTYSIEVITTTNMPLEFRVYKGNNMTANIIDSDTTTTDSDGVYYRHLLMNGVSQMNYSSNVTDTYTLWVQLPTTSSSNLEVYAGIIDIVDIKINSEQVV